MVDMSFYAYAAFCLFLAWAATRFLFKSKSKHEVGQLPPGPIRAPIFGNLFQLGQKPHRRLTELASIHGPLMTLHLGFRIVVVVSDAASARDVFAGNDVVLSNRSVEAASTALRHHDFSILWLPNGARWHRLRKLLNSHLFSGPNLDLGRRLRERKVADLVSFVGRRADKREEVDVGDAVFSLTLNFMSNTIFSMDVADSNLSAGGEFKEAVRGVSDASGKTNLADFFPFMRVFDPQGIRRTVARHFGKMMALLDGFVGDRLAGNSGVPPESEQDMLGVLLKFSRDDNSDITRPFITHILMDLFITGTDTSASTVEYAVSELIKNPHKMRKLREELDNVIGRGNPIQESDISKLPYLQAVVKETLRLHPPIPLSPRQSHDTNIIARGFSIPKGTQVWVNIWAIGRDPNVWPDPLEFKPERHAGSESEYRSKEFEVIPFGSGRRSCPGLPLVMRMVPLVLGSLVHSFDWKLEGDERLDMEEMYGLTLQKAVPLRAIPVKLDLDSTLR